METAAFGIREREREIQKAVTLPVVVLKTPTFWNQLRIRWFEKAVDEKRAGETTAFGITERVKREKRNSRQGWKLEMELN
jgi:hypothetical protein